MLPVVEDWFCVQSGSHFWVLVWTFYVYRLQVKFVLSGNLFFVSYISSTFLLSNALYCHVCTTKLVCSFKLSCIFGLNSSINMLMLWLTKKSTKFLRAFVVLEFGFIISFSLYACISAIMHLLLLVCVLCFNSNNNSAS